MKEKMTGMRWVEKMYWVLWKVLPTTALLCALRWAPTEWFAQKISGVTDGALTTDVVKKDAIHSKITMMPSSWIEVQSDDWPWIEPKPKLWEDDDTIDLWPLARWTPVKAPDKWLRELDEDQKEPEVTGPKWDEIKIPKEIASEGLKKEKSKISVHGMVRWWSDVTPLLWSVLSDKPALMLSIDVSHPKTWLWTTLIRLDDFDKSMDSPASQVTILDMYWQKQIWKASVMLDGEYMTIDKLSGADSFTPIVWCTYDAWKWWTLDTWAWHCFQKWDDVDVVRLWITKKLDECLSLAAQGFYSSDLSKKFYGRVQADVKLWGWFGVQLSFIAKEWEITPTAWVLYKF